MNASEILPPFGRLNDIEKGFSLKIAMAIAPKFSQNQKTSFKKSEAFNLLIINANSWFFRLIFSIQKNQKSMRKQIVYRRKTWRRIFKSCWRVDWFFFKFCPFREGDLFFREGVFGIAQPFQFLTFSKAKNQTKKSEIGIVIQRVREFWFFEGCFRILIKNRWKFLLDQNFRLFHLFCSL